MFFGKIRCPACGVRNSKERMTCAGCGAPLMPRDIAPETAPPLNRSETIPQDALGTPESPTQAHKKLFDGAEIIFSSPAATTEHAKAEVILTGEKLVFRPENSRTDIPLAGIKGFDAKFDYTAVSYSRNFSLQGLAVISHLDDGGKRLETAFYMDKGNLQLLQHNLYKKTAGRYIDTDETKIQRVYNLTAMVMKGLSDAGMEARLAAPKQLEEKIEAKYSLGLISINSGPIRWLNVHTNDIDSRNNVRFLELNSNSVSTLFKTLYNNYYYTFIPELYYTDYGIPDESMPADYPETAIFLSRDNGRLKWISPAAAALADKLNKHPELLHPIFNENNIVITSYPSYSCWIISVKGAIIPDLELWDCYRGIAELLVK